MFEILAEKLFLFFNFLFCFIYFVTEAVIMYVMYFLSCHQEIAESTVFSTIFCDVQIS